jgi:D-sedoheptulose 7-phosphate isomerase
MGDSGADTARRDLNALAELATVAARELGDDMARTAAVAADALAAGGKLLFCGNGGSAAAAQHLATEYVVRFRGDRMPLSALALTTDPSILTAAGNDYGFDQVFARQVRALGRPGDILFLHTTSGRSPNLLRAAEAAREQGLTTIGVLAAGGGALARLVDHALIVPTGDGARAQELQLAVGHIICKLVEERFHAEH